MMDSIFWASYPIIIDTTDYFGNEIKTGEWFLEGSRKQ
jgi:hypothetical protein